MQVSLGISQAHAPLFYSMVAYRCFVCYEVHICISIHACIMSSVGTIDFVCPVHHCCVEANLVKYVIRKSTSMIQQSDLFLLRPDQSYHIISCRQLYYVVSRRVASRRIVVAFGFIVRVFPRRVV